MRKANLKYALLQMSFWTAAASGYGFMTQILQNMGFGNDQIGILNAVKLLATVVFQMLIGSFSDRFAKKIPLKAMIAVLAAAAAALTGVFYLGPFSFPGTLLLFIGFGGTFTCISPLIDSLAVLYNNQGEKINYAWGRAAGSAAYAVACIGFGVFCDAFGVSKLLLLQLVFTLAILVTALWMERGQSKAGEKEDTPGSKAEQLAGAKLAEVQLTEQEKNKVHSLWYLLREYPKFTCFLLGAAIMFMAYNLGTTFLINVIEELGGGNTHYGMAEFMLAVSEIPSALIMTRYRKKIPMDKLMVGCAFFMMLKNAFAAFSGNITVIILSQSCEMLGFGLFYSGSVYLVDEMLPAQDTVKGMSFVNAATVGLGEGVGSFVCGFFRNHFGLHGLMAISVLVGLISVGCMAVMCLLPERRRTGFAKKKGVSV